MSRYKIAALFGLLVIFIVAFLSTMTMASAAKSANHTSQEEDGAGYPVARQEPPVSLSLSTNPTAVTPGQHFVLNLEIINRQSVSFSPSITVNLPENVSPEISQLPPGVTYGFQDGTYTWQPMLDAVGSSSVSLVLKADLASIQQPEQSITAKLSGPGFEINTATIIWVGVLPTAGIVFDPPQAAVGQPIQMIGLVSGPGPVSQEWDLGDGRIANAQDPVVIYPSEGTYDITLKASNPLGYATARSVVSIIAQPIAHFHLNDTTVAVGQEISINNQSGGARPLAFTWDFNDGFGSQEETPQHRYTTPGNYLIRLEVRNEFGRSESYSQVVVGSPPVADAVVPTQGKAGQVVELEAFTDDSVSEVVWDMGDGRTASGSEGRHVYWVAGEYLIQMTAINEFGRTSVSSWLQISPGSLFLYLPLAVSSSTLDFTTRANSLGLVAKPTIESLEVVDQLEVLDFPDTAGPADKLLAYVNQARQLNDLRPLRYGFELSIAAQRHSDDMSTSGVLGHTGSDQSSPSLRIVEAGYPGGYGGEATAWGMEDPIEPVRFWLNSPSHRAILLHPGVSDVGIGFSLNYNSPNIWYWTAEFGSLSLPQIVIQPTAVPEEQDPNSESSGISADVQISNAAIQLLGPPQNSQFDLRPSNSLYFTWSWGQPLSEGQHFDLVIGPAGTSGLTAGTTDVPYSGSQYQLEVKADRLAGGPGIYFWQINLVGFGGEIISQSSIWPLVVTSNGGSESGPTVSPSPAATVGPTRTPEPVVQPTPLPLSTPLPTTTP